MRTGTPLTIIREQPLDVVEDQDAIVRYLEAMESGSSRQQQTQAVAEAGLREKRKREALRVGLPPYFTDD